MENKIAYLVVNGTVIFLKIGRTFFDNEYSVLKKLGQ